MNKVVVLRLNHQLHDGGYQVIAEVGEEGHTCDVEVQGYLPALPTGLMNKLKNWRDSFSNLEFKKRLKVKKLPPTDTFTYPTNKYGHTQTPQRDSKEICQKLGDEVSADVNSWLNSKDFLDVILRLHTELKFEDNIQIIIRTDDIRICYLPWNCWRLLEIYKHSEISFSISTESYSCETTRSTRRLEGLKILMIFGDDEGIDLNKDCEILKKLSSNYSNVFFHSIYQPSQRELEAQLRKGCWDLLFFSGHSETCDGEGLIYLGNGKSVSLYELQSGLKEAVSRGLKLAIFNSCDGLGLAKDFQEFQIPQVIVMREPIPDELAHEFLSAYIEGILRLKSHTPLYLVERYAREKIKFYLPHADWLPIIFQNHKVVSPITGNIRRSTSNKSINNSSNQSRGFPLEVELETPPKICKIINPVGGKSVGKIQYNGRIWRAKLFPFEYQSNIQPLFPEDEAYAVARHGGLYFVLPKEILVSNHFTCMNKNKLRSLVSGEQKQFRNKNKHRPHLIVLPIVCFLGILAIFGLAKSFDLLIASMTVENDDLTNDEQVEIYEPIQSHD